MCTPKRLTLTPPLALTGIQAACTSAVPLTFCGARVPVHLCAMCACLLACVAVMFTCGTCGTCVAVLFTCGTFGFCGTCGTCGICGTCVAVLFTCGTCGTCGTCVAVLFTCGTCGICGTCVAVLFTCVIMCGVIGLFVVMCVASYSCHKVLRVHTCAKNVWRCHTRVP